MMKNIRILFISLLLALPMIAFAQDKTFEFYYIAHDYSTRVESICSMLEETYEVALEYEDCAVVFYLPNGEKPIVVKMNIPGDNRRDFNDLLSELRTRYTHDSYVYVDLPNMVDIINSADFIDEEGNPLYRSARFTWFINSSFWDMKYNESLISASYFILELDKYRDYVTIDIWDTGDERIRVNRNSPFGKKNLSGNYRFNLLTL